MQSDTLLDFEGGNDKQRKHINKVISAVKEHGTEIDAIKTNVGEYLEIFCIQDTKRVLVAFRDAQIIATFG